MRARGGGRHGGDDVARPVRVRVDRLRSRGATGVRRRSCAASSRSSCGLARRRRLAGAARAVRAAPGPVGRRRARGLPDGRAAVPARRGGARRVAGSGHAPAGAPAARARRGAGPGRRRPADVERARSRPPRGTARGRAVRRRRAARRARARAVGRPAARRRDRQQGVGAARARARSCSRCPARRVLCLLVAAGVAGAILAPPMLRARRQRSSRLTRATAAPSSSIFQPWQVWWFLGHHGAVVRGTFGRVKPGYRTGPPWTGDDQPPADPRRRAATRRAALVAPARPPPSCGAGVDAPSAWPRARLRTRDARATRDALLLLALLLLLRCMLDTWDTAYYLLPFLLALHHVGEPRRRTRPARARAREHRARMDRLRMAATRTRAPTCRPPFFLALDAAAGRGPRLGALRARRRSPALASVHPRERRGAHATTVSSFGSPLNTRAAVVGHRGQVLDAHADAPRDVDAGLDRHDVPRAQRLLGRGGARAAAPRGPPGPRRGRGCAPSARRGPPAQSPRARPRRPRHPAAPPPAPRPGRRAARAGPARRPRDPHRAAPRRSRTSRVQSEQ